MQEPDSTLKKKEWITITNITRNVDEMDLTHLKKNAKYMANMRKTPNKK